jgi:hypothetical protein
MAGLERKMGAWDGSFVLTSGMRDAGKKSGKRRGKWERQKIAKSYCLKVK